MLLDGYPRNEKQAAFLEAELAKDGAKVAKAVWLDVPEEVLVGKLSHRLYAAHSSRENEGVVWSIGKFRPTLEICAVPVYDIIPGRASRLCNRTADSAAASCY